MTSHYLVTVFKPLQATVKLSPLVNHSSKSVFDDTLAILDPENVDGLSYTICHTFDSRINLLCIIVTWQPSWICFCCHFCPLWDWNGELSRNDVGKMLISTVPNLAFHKFPPSSVFQLADWLCHALH